MYDWIKDFATKQEWDETFSKDIHCAPLSKRALTTFVSKVLIKVSESYGKETQESLEDCFRSLDSWRLWACVDLYFDDRFGSAHFICTNSGDGKSISCGGLILQLSTEYPKWQLHT